MLGWLLHAGYLLRASGGLALAFLRAAWYFRTRALKDLQLPSTHAWRPEVQRRWRHYFFGTTYLSAVFGILRGKLPGAEERRLFNLLAALACFFDDLVDANRTPDGAIGFWRDNPEQYGRNADPSGLALHLFYRVNTLLPPGDLPEFQQFLYRVFNVETAGRQRNGPPPPTDELARLTAEKGGCSVLLFRRAMPHPLSEAEQAALFEFGYLVQLCDDIFDLWFDRRQHTATLATALTEQNGLSGLKVRFEQQVTTTLKAVRRTPYARWQRETAARAIHILVCITRVALRRYQALQRQYGTLPLDDRAAMVVDMGRWSNRLRVMVEVLKWKRLN